MKLCTDLSNQSYVRVTNEASATATLCYHITRDGAAYDAVTRDVTLFGSQLLPMSSDRDGTEVMYTFQEPGVYEISVEIVRVSVAGSDIREAYVQNNLLHYARVTVTQPD